MIDPRTSVIAERMKDISRIIAVSSGKGGVGKSLVATILAVILSRKGCKIGLIDLDFTSPSTHLILGAKNAQPTENKGLIPATVEDLKYMSLIYYSGNRATPLRGADTSNIFVELLAVTLWGELDFLIIDTPPGIGDALLDLVRLVPQVEFLIVTTPSPLAFETVKKQVNLLKELKVSILGLVENMKMTAEKSVQQQTEALGLKFLGGIPFDSKVEVAIGNPERLLGTKLGEKVKKIAQTV